MIVSPERLLRPHGFTDRERVAEAWADSMRAFREGLADPSILDVGIMVGIPGSGKSTWVEANDTDSVMLFDAVWANRGRRVAVAKRIRAAGKNAIAVVVKTPISVAMVRNASRPAWRRVPEGVIRKAARDLRVEPPTMAEGWSGMITVDGTG